jgi:hypothetical protein
MAGYRLWGTGTNAERDADLEQAISGQRAGLAATTPRRASVSRVHPARAARPGGGADRRHRAGLRSAGSGLAARAVRPADSRWRSRAAGADRDAGRPGSGFPVLQAGDVRRGRACRAHPAGGTSFFKAPRPYVAAARRRPSAPLGELTRAAPSGARWKRGGWRLGSDDVLRCAHGLAVARCHSLQQAAYRAGGLATGGDGLPDRATWLGPVVVARACTGALPAGARSRSIIRETNHDACDQVCARRARGTSTSAAGGRRGAQRVLRGARDSGHRLQRRVGFAAPSLAGGLARPADRAPGGAARPRVAQEGDLSDRLVSGSRELRHGLLATERTRLDPLASVKGGARTRQSGERSALAHDRSSAGGW